MDGIMNKLANKPNDPADGVKMGSVADKLDAELMSRAFSYGFTIRKAQARDFGAFEKDIDDEDRAALSQTWRQDWRNELYATMIQSDHAFLQPELVNQNHSCSDFIMIGRWHQERRYGWFDRRPLLIR